MDNVLKALDECKTKDVIDPNGSTDTYVQLVISITLGLSSFFGFCVSNIARGDLYLFAKL